jgi:serine O-acetyltransferase
VIGANAVVNKSFPEGNQTLGGVPATVISSKTSEGLLLKGYTQAGH